MRLAMPRIFETRADGAFLPSRPPARVVPRGSAPLRGAIESWELAVLVVVALVLIVVARDGIDLSGIPFTGWIHP
jgi:hypothetical protein